MLRSMEVCVCVWGGGAYSEPDPLLPTFSMRRIPSENEFVKRLVYQELAFVSKDSINFLA